MLFRSQPFPAEPHEKKLLGLAASQPTPILYRPVGCVHCENQGYRGRIAIMELLRLDSELDDLISRRASLHEIRTAAITKGFQPLAADGLRRVRDGTSSLEEVGRVVDLTDRM